tara:strand:- start:390 stop:707 length:318 start_codon:yes stop_codon:yes gene_type:complete
MAYDNRNVSPLKIKGSPYKKDDTPKVGENYTAYARRTMSKAEFAKWDSYTDGPKSHRRTKVWNGKEWVKASEYKNLKGPEENEAKDNKKKTEKGEFFKRFAVKGK